MPNSKFKIQNSKFLIILLLLITIPLLTTTGYSASKYDLALQRDIYRYTNYTSSRSLSLLILMNVKDDRPSNEKNGGFIEDQTTNDDWKRPMEIMLADILTQEMQKSGLIKLIPATPENADYRLTVKILSLYGGTKEKESGSTIKRWFVPRMAVGAADIRMILYDKSGKEIVSVDFIANAQQELGRMSNFHLAAIKNMALALREAVAQLLKDLDDRLQTPKS